MVDRRNCWDIRRIGNFRVTAFADTLVHPHRPGLGHSDLLDLEYGPGA
jgi:hypothetical protein